MLFSAIFMLVLTLVIGSGTVIIAKSKLDEDDKKS